MRISPHVWLAFLLPVPLALSFGFDAGIEGWASQPHSTVTLQMARIVSQVADWPCLLSVILAGAILLWRRAPALSHGALTLALASALCGLGAGALKSLTGRTRPSVPIHQQGWFGIRSSREWLVGCHSHNSFPSGHTATVAGFAGALLCMSRRHGLAALCFGAFVAWSRIVLHCHHLSDTVAALMLGFPGGWMCAKRIMPWIDDRLRPGPPVAALAARGVARG